MSAPRRKPLNVAALGAAAIPQPDPVHEANRSKAVAIVPDRPLAAVASEVAAVEVTAGKRASSREGLVQIQGYFPPETRRRLKMLSAKMDKSQEALLAVALEYLFEKYEH